MRFKRSADPFPRKLLPNGLAPINRRWLRSSGEDDHRIVQLIAKTNNSPIFTYDGKNLTLDPQISTKYDTIFFRPHVFYGNNDHQVRTNDKKYGLSYRPIGVRFMSGADDGVETFVIDPNDWEIAGVWEDTEFDGKDWHSHASKQDLKKIFDDWSLPRNVDKIPGKPNKWVFNEASPNRWPGIKIDGTDHSIWLGDRRSVKQMLANLGVDNTYDAINMQSILP